MGEPVPQSPRSDTAPTASSADIERERRERDAAAITRIVKQLEGPIPSGDKPAPNSADTAEQRDHLSPRRRQIEEMLDQGGLIDF